MLGSLRLAYTLNFPDIGMSVMETARRHLTPKQKATVGYSLGLTLGIPIGSLSPPQRWHMRKSDSQTISHYILQLTPSICAFTGVDTVSRQQMIHSFRTGAHFHETAEKSATEVPFE